MSESDLHKLDQIIDTFKDSKDLTVSASCDYNNEFDDFDNFEDFADYLSDNDNIEMYITGTIYNNYEFLLNILFRERRKKATCIIDKKESKESIIRINASSIQDLYNKFIKQLGDD